MRYRILKIVFPAAMLAAVYMGGRQTPQAAAAQFAETGGTAMESVPSGELSHSAPDPAENVLETETGLFGLPVREEELWEAERLLAAEGMPSEDEEDTPESEYANLAIADVTDYVNVRSLPGTDGEIVGKIYDGAVAQILETAGEEDDWFHVTSGSVEGYIKAEYFLYGQEALDVIDDYVTKYVQVQADRLNVRKAPDQESGRIGYLDQGERALLLEDCGDWCKVQYSHGEEGYVASQYVLRQDEFSYAKSIEEERQERERQRAMRERQKASEESAPEKTSNVTPPNTNYSSVSELREEIIAYAKQFLGNKYVHGGNSLTEGTDCSGFTSLIYAAFGYAIGRTPSSQLSSAGRGIDYSEIQKGDIICYGKNGKCTHVAIYIGDGQIIHAANVKKGIVIYQADYDHILGIRNVID